jgi:hypothetical protein
MNWRGLIGTSIASIGIALSLVVVPTSVATNLANADVRQRVAELDAISLTKVQKANLGLELLRDEIASSSTDRRTHDAVLAEIVGKLRDADAPTIRSSWRGASGELKSTLGVLVLLQGGAESAGDAKDVLLDHRGHRLQMRLLAVEGLSNLAGQAQDNEEARELGRVFAQVLWEDPQWRPLSGKGKLAGEYPVRKVAATAIKKLQQRGVRMESYVTAAAEESVLEFEGSAVS